MRAIAMLSLFSASVSAQYTCKSANCLTVVPTSPGGWIVGEIRSFAFGGNASDRIVIQLHNAGWLECEGQTLDNTDFAALYKAIGDTWGSKDPKNSFLVPDLRGMFLRGWNHFGSQADHTAGFPDPEVSQRAAPRPELQKTGSAGNSGDSVGSMQPNEFQSHTHTIKDYKPGPLNSQQGNGTYALIGTGSSDTLGPSGSAGAETRPNNAYVMYFIYVGKAVANLDSKSGKVMTR
jgi:microcystin-dependent protein